MNNYKNALDSWWNKNFALNEFFGLFLLSFLIFITIFYVKKELKNDYALSFIIGIEVFIVLIITNIGGKLYAGESATIPFLNPISVLINAQIRNMYKGLMYLIIFEFLGSIAGMMVALLTIKGLNGKIRIFVKQHLKFDNSKWNQSFIKEVIMNLVLSLTLISVPLFSWINNTVDSTMAFLSFSLIIIILLILTSKNGFFVFCLPITVVILISKLIFSNVTKKELINVCTACFVHIIIAILLGFVFYEIIKKNSLNWLLS